MGSLSSSRLRRRRAGLEWPNGLLGASGLRLLAIAGLLLAGCEWPRMSPESTLSGLVAIRGQASLPMDYVVAADSRPAPRTFRPALTTMEGATLAVGTVLDAAGNFSVHVPASSLAARPTLYEVALRDPSKATYRSLVRLTSQHQEASVTVDGSSSTIALAAREALRLGRDPSGWALETLLKDPQIRSMGLQYANQLARWSNGPAIASEPPAPASATLQQVMAIAARP